uniref:Uncharacterized protein n=1 Tax=Arundo donax TaxID=35708 RepID=A0A0A8YZC0_ARUDO
MVAIWTEIVLLLFFFYSNDIMLRTVPRYIIYSK